MTLGVSGCSRKSAVSTSDLQSSFKSAEPAMQTLVDKAVGSVKSNNYPEALSDLQVLAHKARLTPDQQQALQDTMEMILNKISSATNAPTTAPQKNLDPMLQLMRKQK
jgi:hypothetical protein